MKYETRNMKDEKEIQNMKYEIWNEIDEYETEKRRMKDMNKKCEN